MSPAIQGYLSQWSQVFGHVSQAAHQMLSPAALPMYYQQALAAAHLDVHLGIGFGALTAVLGVFSTLYTKKNRMGEDAFCTVLWIATTLTFVMTACLLSNGFYGVAHPASWAVQTMVQTAKTILQGVNTY